MAYQWIHKIAELIRPSMILKAQHDEIREAITELQDNVLVNAVSPDGSVSVIIQQGEIQLSVQQSTTEDQNVINILYNQLGAPVLIGQGGEPVLNRQMIIYDEEQGAWVTVDLVEQTVITDIQYDSSGHSVQKKTRLMLGIPLGDESGWTEITGGDVVQETV